MRKKQRKTSDDAQGVDPDATDTNNQEASTSSGDEDEEFLEGANEDDNDDELMADDLENADFLDFDFEALPLHQNDKEGIVNMLTQIFLLAKVDKEAMAQKMIERSPLGCVFLPAEDNADDGNENVVYGVLSLLPLDPDENYVSGFWSLLIDRAEKYAMDTNLASELKTLSSNIGDYRVVLLVNERMLHFSSAIAKPAFQDLISDLGKNKEVSNFTHVIVIMKVRIADVGLPRTSDAAKKRKRKLKKAEKRRLRALAAESAEVIFDNPEEKLLFEEMKDVKFFQYPVQSDVDRGSKFNTTVINGVTFQPYRRVCILTHESFNRFARSIANYDP